MAYHVSVRQMLVQVVARAILAVGHNVLMPSLLQELAQAQLILHTACGAHSMRSVSRSSEMNRQGGPDLNDC